MPGAGAYPAGIGPAGFSPATDATGRESPLPLAAFYDPNKRAFPFNDDGEAVGVHPVDQEAVLRVTVDKGSIKCAPNVGISFKRIRTASKSTLLRIIDDEIRSAWAPMVATGDITILGVTLAVEGVAIAYADYRNNRTRERMVVPVS